MANWHPPQKMTAMTSLCWCQIFLITEHLWRIWEKQMLLSNSQNLSNTKPALKAITFCRLKSLAYGQYSRPVDAPISADGLHFVYWMPERCTLGHWHPAWPNATQQTTTWCSSPGPYRLIFRLRSRTESNKFNGIRQICRRFILVVSSLFSS